MTIFTKIIQGEIPCYKVFEDEFTFAFLDIHPLTLGHTLLVPKQEIPDYRQLTEPYFSAIWENSKKIGDAICKATNSVRVGLMVDGMGVPDHFHLHLIPIFTSQSMDISNAHTETEKNMKAIQQKIITQLIQ